MIIILMVVVFFNKSSQEQDIIIGSVNGEMIYQSEYDSELSRLPAPFQEQVSRETIISRVVERKLLLQKAEQAGIKEEDVVAEVIKNNNLTEKELNIVLQRQGITMKRFEENLEIQEFIKQSLLSNISVSDKEIQEYYNRNNSNNNYNNSAAGLDEDKNSSAIIKQIILEEKQKEVYESYIQDLGSEANIIDCVEKPEADICS